MSSAAGSLPGRFFPRGVFHVSLLLLTYKTVRSGRHGPESLQQFSCKHEGCGGYHTNTISVYTTNFPIHFICLLQVILAALALAVSVAQASTLGGRGGHHHHHGHHAGQRRQARPHHPQRRRQNQVSRQTAKALPKFFLLSSDGTSLARGPVAMEDIMKSMKSSVK